MRAGFVLFMDFILRGYQYRSLIWTMALREIRSRYAGTAVGFTWFFINPLMTILVYWLVFSLGFKVKPVNGVSFIVMFLCGMIPYTTLNEALVTSANCISSNPHLVKKTVFPTEMLPIVNLLSSFMSNAFMTGLLVVFMLCSGISFSLYNLQIFYYLFGLCVFCVGLGWLLAALSVFFRDLGQILAVILNLWFWATPIVWEIQMVPEQYRIFLKLNPLYYVVEGYKASFIFHKPFWLDWWGGIYFWGFALLMFVVGALVFRKLKPEFADVL
ncbi:ABC transporter permease [Maridesulfovibrio zosterae]|uniref:ABC transporter permease n=1 Tax=Maridesulfovibrio zosterae TaxID=82171 RepID=UPI0005529C58|nr:ABC transporter permease [Maridesulfovibrio zosterae]